MFGIKYAKENMRELVGTVEKLERGINILLSAWEVCYDMDRGRLREFPLLQIHILFRSTADFSCRQDFVSRPSFLPFTRKSLRDYKLRNFSQKFVRPELDRRLNSSLIVREMCIYRG